jgi:hypothetical protein
MGYMIRFRLFWICLLTFSVSFAGDPGIPDTVRVDSATAYPGGDVILPVYFSNDEALNLVEIVLGYNAEYLTLDTFSFEGGRLENIIDSLQVFHLKSDSNFVIAVQTWTWLGWIPRGNGIFCNLHFQIKSAAAQHTVVIDSSYFAPGHQTLFTDSVCYSLYPQFVQGHITVLELPPSPDSVWVESVNTRPDSLTKINIYGYNEEPLSGVRLAFDYISDNIGLDSVIIAGTRSENASLSYIEDTLTNEIMIIMDYNISPLPPDSGILASLIFRTRPGGYDDTALIDSSAYLGQRLEFIPQGDDPFVPYFRSGSIFINQVIKGRDSVRLDSVLAAPGSTFTIAVNAHTEKDLTDVVIPLAYSSDALIFKDVVFDNTRGASAVVKNVANDSLSGEMMIALSYGSVNSLPPGDGPLAKIKFQVKSDADEDTLFIDTANYLESQSLEFMLHHGGSFAPSFFPGRVIVEKPVVNFSDSIWVDNIIVSPGRTITVNVYEHNDSALSKAQVALKYSDDDLNYNSIVLNGTRGSLAQSSIIEADSGKILITLLFNSSPLASGSGKLASILFSVPSNSSGGIVAIDSTTFKGESNEFSPIGHDPITPRFTPGSVEIRKTTDVDDDKNVIIPTEFALGQNYPNPFNPSTKIKFDLPEGSQVVLEVYNVLGQKARTLIDRFLPAGSYYVTFDGRGDDGKQLASGVYYYRISAGSFSRSRMMMLLK